MEPIIEDKAFLKMLKTAPSGGYLLYGDEEYLKDRCLAVARETLITDETLAMFNEFRIDGLHVTPDDLIAALEPLPMMADKKLVIVRGFRPTDWRKEDIDAFIRVFEAIPKYDHNLVLVTCPSDIVFEVRPRSNDFDTYCKGLTPVSFMKAKPAQLQTWVARHFAANGIEAPLPLCGLLIQRCGDGMYPLSYEIDKLCWYLLSQERTQLTEEDIEYVTVQDKSFGAFDLSNALLAQKKDAALRILNHMNFNRVEPIYVLTQITSLFCDQLEIRNLMEEGKTRKDIAQILHMNDFRVGLYMQGIGNMSAQRIRDILRQCAKADAMMKRGKADYEPLEFLICST